MARKRYAEDAENAENHERWLISYADFITLLFAFFVVMYAISSVNEGKVKVLSASLGDAFGKHGAEAGAGGAANAPPAFSLPDLVRKRRQEALRREREALTRLAQGLKATLGPLVREGKVRVTQSGIGVSIEINASVLFEPGQAALTARSRQALGAVALLLRDDPHLLQVEGHTDPTPISNAQFASNWELSAVRAASVVRLFIDSGVDERRLTVLGHGANMPVAPNGAPEGRARNRRVAVTIVSKLPGTAEEIAIP
ncbi:flagellar motor protein MotD [Massilia glaciei]|uniref:Flagellar motor protein MotD n=1 Tax=Massilia glaciei TaxID=1524097 RepID=A0A2U2HN03_9BURK|nr:flagellar motor protein MotD [Massilia glaciei]PWF48888.1 flagellar motor protein MotD [Massilia glaciei]